MFLYIHLFIFRKGGGWREQATCNKIDNKKKKLMKLGIGKQL